MAEPLRVLHALNGLDPRLGGPPVAVGNIVVAAARQGIEIELVACDAGAADVEALTADLRRESVILHVFPISGRAEPLVRWGISGPMLSYLRRRIPDFDVVHVHGAWSATTLVAALRARIAGVPVVLTPHETLTDFDIDISRSRLRTRQKRILGAALMRLVDVIVFSSEIERRDSRIAARSDARVLAHPVVDEPAHRPRRSPTHRPLRIGFLGRLHSKKNLGALIEAVSRCEGVELVVAGSAASAEEEAEYRALARAAGLDGRIAWRGFVTADAKGDFLSEIDVLAMPSLYECFGVSAVEAMDAGVPVIASETVGVATAIRDYEAGIVTAHDADSLARAIARLRDDPDLRARCSEGAARAAAEEFSFDRFGAEIQRVYGDLA